MLTDRKLIQQGPTTVAGESRPRIYELRSDQQPLLNRSSLLLFEIGTGGLLSDERFTPDAPVEPHRSRVPSPWKLASLAAVLLLLVVAVALIYPEVRNQWLIQRVQNMGGRVVTEPTLPMWLRVYTNSFRLGERVVSVDLSHSGITDDNLRLLYSFRRLRELTLLGETFVTDEGIAEFRRVLPDVLIRRRGDPLLGIGGYAVPGGLQLLQIVPMSGAEQAGLRLGDIITGVGSHTVTEMPGVVRYLQQHRPGDTLEVRFLRNGAPQTMTVELGAWK